ncbi:glucose-6-phosphate dehydrogenase, partial [Candidatus Saccharibacteria bacterium]|nr:glucose-6-phosphate dehydrogenase [Candidatus Saccharibacteria bacterium]
MKYRPTILVIVGITGDLSRRKLLPAMNRLGKSGEVSEQLQIVGVSRSSDVEVAQLTKNIEDPSYLHAHTEMFQMGLTDRAEYARLAKRLKEIEQQFGAPAQRLFYLSVPPQVSRPIIDLLGASGLASGEAKLLLEKPFGTDLASATE